MEGKLCHKLWHITKKAVVRTQKCANKMQHYFIMTIIVIIIWPSTKSPVNSSFCPNLNKSLERYDHYDYFYDLVIRYISYWILLSSLSTPLITNNFPTSIPIITITISPSKNFRHFSTSLCKELVFRHWQRTLIYPHALIIIFSLCFLSFCRFCGMNTFIIIFHCVYCICIRCVWAKAK